VGFWSIVLLTSTVSGQVRVRGQINGGSLSDLTALSVELVDSSRHAQADRAYVNASGVFELGSVANGLYEMRVMRQDGTVISREQIAVSPSLREVAVTLPEEPATQPGAGTISVTQLQHKPSSKARKAFAASEKKSQKGDVAGAIDKLNEAIALDPEYMEAYNNLGCKLIATDRPEEAVQALQRAIDIDAHAPLAHANLAAALLALHRPAEAERAARTALDTGGALSTTRYLLGLSLIHQRKFTHEAVQSLRQAEDQYPAARLAAAAALERLGEVQAAKVELDGYLSSGVPERRVEVKAWLSRLK